MFRDLSNGTSVTGFINKCINDIVPTVTICTYPNQNPWIKGNIRTELKARAAAFMSRTLIWTLIFARFEDNTVPPTQPVTKECGLSFSMANVSKTFKRVNPRQAAGPDGIPSRVLRGCADQLAVCLRTHSISPCPSLLSPHASRWPPFVLYPRKQR
jgi:hypothetical protein